MIERIAAVMAVTVLLLGTGLSSQATADERVRCESRDGDYHYCRIDTGNRVRLMRELSRSPCIQGRTWDYDRRGIWVDRGCRGEFLVGRGKPHHRPNDRPGQARTIRCESRDGGYNHCRVDTRGRVVLLKQLSDRPCVRTRSWDVDRSGIWVDRGCRGEFMIGR